MASVPFVGTLESDDDVDQLDNESDSDEESNKVCRHYIYTSSPFMPMSKRFLLVSPSVVYQENENQEERQIAF